MLNMQIFVMQIRRFRYLASRRQVPGTTLSVRNQFVIRALGQEQVRVIQTRLRSSIVAATLNRRLSTTEIVCLIRQRDID
jgi:hypothetical protein